MNDNTEDEAAVDRQLDEQQNRIDEREKTPQIHSSTNNTRTDSPSGIVEATVPTVSESAEGTKDAPL